MAVPAVHEQSIVYCSEKNTNAMSKPSSSIYRTRIPYLRSRLQSAIDKGAQKSTTIPEIFFRADDIGYPSKQFSHMIDSFKASGLPLCLATVPAWLTSERFTALRRVTGTSDKQWCWHQHGYVHRNFETTGKKQEFGPARDQQQIYSSLAEGQQRLNAIGNTIWHPVFTPPWNRCSEETLGALQELGFKAVSRSKNASPRALSLTDFQVNVDLHTRKEASAKEGLEILLGEIETSIASGRCGFMLHHPRMNRRSFEFLDILLHVLKKRRGVRFVHFGDLLDKSY